MSAVCNAKKSLNTLSVCVRFYIYLYIYYISYTAVSCVKKIKKKNQYLPVVLAQIFHDKTKNKTLYFRVEGYSTITLQPQASVIG